MSDPKFSTLRTTMISPRLVFFLVLRGWRGNRWRTALTILGIALGIAVVTAVHVMDHNTIQSRLRQRTAQRGTMDFELSAREAGRSLEDTVASLRARDSIAEVGVVVRVPVDVVSQAAGGLAVPATFYGLSPLHDGVFARFALSEGAVPAPRDAAGDADDPVPAPLLVGTGWLAAGDELEVGRSVTLRSRPRALRPRCIDGELQERRMRAPDPLPEREVEVAGILEEQRLGALHEGLALVGPLDVARELGPRLPPIYQIRAAYGADTDALYRDLDQEFLIREESAALIGESSDERAFRNGVKLLGGLALMLGMFVVFQTLSQSLVERLRQIGLLRCLGTSGTNITAVFLVDALAMALSGAVLGLVLGIGLAALLQQLEFSSLGMLQNWSLTEVPVRPLLGTAVLGLLFTLAGSIFPLLRARRLSPVKILHARGLDQGRDVLRGVNIFLFALLVLVLPIGYLGMTTLLSDSERETQIVLLQLGGLLLVFGGVLLLAPQLVRLTGAVALAVVTPVLRLPSHLVRKAMARQTGRFAASVCGLGVVLLATIALESLTTALHEEARTFGRRAMPNSLYASGYDVPRERMAALEAIPGVRSVEALHGPVAAPFQISGLAPETLIERMPEVFADPELRRRYEARRSLVMSPRLARLLELEPGDPVAVLTGGGPEAYTVLCIDERAGCYPPEPAFALAHPRWVKQDFCLDLNKVDRVILRLDEEARPAVVRRAAEQAIPSLRRFRHGDDHVAYLVRDVTRDFRLFQVLLLLILGLAGMGVVNAMTIAALGRAREIGVLRALGASRGQLRVAFLLEGAVTGLLAALVALALGVPLGRLVVQGMNQVAGLDAPYVVPSHVLWLVPVGAMVIGMAAALLPGAKAARMSPAQAVRFE